MIFLFASADEVANNYGQSAAKFLILWQEHNKATVSRASKEERENK
jgi:hypothetical protein